MTEVCCQFCGEPIDPSSRYTWHRVQGWERPGTAGGSDITLRQRPPLHDGGGVACDPCIRRIKARVSPHQLTLT